MIQPEVKYWDGKRVGEETQKFDSLTKAIENFLGQLKDWESSGSSYTLEFQGIVIGCTTLIHLPIILSILSDCGETLELRINPY